MPSAIAEAVRSSGAVVAVGYQYRAIDFLPDLRAAVEGDALGMLTSYSVGATAGRPWFVNQAEGGGQVLERASHHIDLQCAIAGAVEWVQAAGARVDLAGADRPADSDIDDVLTLTLGFRSGAIGSVLVAWTSPGCRRPTRWTSCRRARACTSSSTRASPPAARRRCGRGAAHDAADPARHGAVSRGGPGGRPRAGRLRRRAAAGSLDVALACERALAGGGRVAVAG